MAYVVIKGKSRADCKTRIAISPRLATSRRDIGRGGGGAIVEFGGLYGRRGVCVVPTVGLENCLYSIINLKSSAKLEQLFLK